MEYCNDANYFDSKLVDVSRYKILITIIQRLTPITNQVKLQQYALDILTGLQYVNSQGVIHSDMKLQNLLLNRPSPEDAAQGELPIVKLCDFGLSHIRKPELDGHATMKVRCGT